MTTDRRYEATLIHLEQVVDGFLAAAFVDLGTGRSLAAHSVHPDFDSSAVQVAGHVAIAAQVKLIESLGNGCRLDDILVTTNDFVCFFQPISSHVFLYIAADTEYTNPALVRNAVKQYAEHYRSNADSAVMLTARAETG